MDHLGAGGILDQVQPRNVHSNNRADKIINLIPISRNTQQHQNGVPHPAACKFTSDQPNQIINNSLNDFKFQLIGKWGSTQPLLFFVVLMSKAGGETKPIDLWLLKSSILFILNNYDGGSIIQFQMQKFNSYTESDSSSPSGSDLNICFDGKNLWAATNMAESCSNESCDEDEGKVDKYSSIFSWFAQNNIKAGDPCSINDQYVSQQRESIRNSSSSSSTSLNSSSLLARRNKLVLKP